MGMPSTELIAPAVLFNNPNGLTREQFQTEFSAVHSSSLVQFNQEDPLDSYSLKYKDSRKLIAEELKLGRSVAYHQLWWAIDENGIYFRPFELLMYSDEKDSFGKDIIKYRLTRHENRLGDPQLITIKLPDIGEQRAIGHDGELYLIDNVVSKEPVSSKATAKKQREKQAYNYLLQARAIEDVIEVEDFAKEEDLWAAYPQFGPDNAYDYSKDGGEFNGVTMGEHNFLWVLKDGKYFLDPKTLDLIPAYFSGDSRGEASYGYVDLVLTAELIKHGAWKLLSWNGIMHLGEFFREHPDSKQKYEQAVWDSFTSLAAKEKRMTNTEMLRLRLFPQSLTEQEE